MSSLYYKCRALRAKNKKLCDANKRLRKLVDLLSDAFSKVAPDSDCWVAKGGLADQVDFELNELTHEED